ncbi:MAG: GNAT family N-acetyltransferase [Anaerolineae bacterium]|nr:GNAT family N-acetyltransferase [Anaerolineae bacterium]
MQIIKIDPGDRRAVQRFVKMPFALYAGNPYWAPPLLDDARAQLDPDSHPFYEHSVAAFFVAEQDGSPVGRIGVMDNRNYNTHLGRRDAFFGFFESSDDMTVSRALFEAAFDWARRRGLERMLGSKGMIGADGCGILVEGFDYLPALGLPYNYPYYDALVKDAGFEKESDRLSGYFTGRLTLPERFREIAGKVKARRGYRIKSFKTKDEMRAWIPKVKAVYEDSFEGGGFYPPTDAEMEKSARDIISVATPETIKLVLKEDEVIGFIFAYRNVGRALQKANGRLFPLGWYYLQREQKHGRAIDGNGIGVLKRYHGMGASILLYAELADTLQRMGYDSIEAVLVGEENHESRSAAESLGVVWCKRHRSYFRNL